MYQEIRVYDLRDERANILIDEPSDYAKMFDFIEAVLYDRESELPWELKSDIVFNDDKLLEYTPTPKVMEFLKDYFWHKNSIEMVTVHVMTCGKMTIMCYNDDDGLVSRIVIE